MSGTSYITMWEIPPEPGPEVRAVTDRNGDLFLWKTSRDGQGDRWLPVVWEPPPLPPSSAGSRMVMIGGRGRTWREVLELGPLRDATDEVLPESRPQ